MALYLLRCLWERTAGDPRDRVVWGFHVNATGSAPSAQSWQTVMAQAWASAGASWSQCMQTAYEVSEFQVYDVSAGGAPIDFEAGDTTLFPTTGSAAPQEVQLCCTRWTNDSLGRPRKHGRWYLGPIGAQQQVGDRPSNALRDMLGAFQQSLDRDFRDLAWDPVVVSRTSGLATGYPIVQYSVDDAWDTQRRRGIDPTDDRVYPILPAA